MAKKPGHNARIPAEQIEPGDAIMGVAVLTVSKGCGVVVVGTADGARHTYAPGQAVAVA